MKKTIKTIYKEALDSFKNKKTEYIENDIKTLISSICNIKKTEFILHTNDKISFLKNIKIKSALKKLKKDMPVSKIIGYKYFYNQKFITNKNVLDPRYDSETLIDAFIKTFPNKKEKLNILDLGTGSGCLLLSVLDIYKAAQGLGIDISAKALKVAKKNAKKLHLKNRSQLIKANWFKTEFLTKIRTYTKNQKINVIISNPPYIKTNNIKNLDNNVKTYDPKIALDGGDNGYISYEEIAKKSPSLLKKNGYAIIEAGKNMEKEITSIFKKYNLKFIKSYKDLNNITRALVFKYEK